MSAADVSAWIDHPHTVRAGWMVLHSLWQGGVIMLLAWGLLKGLRNPSARAAVMFASLLLTALCLPVSWLCLERSSEAAGSSAVAFIEWEHAFQAPATSASLTDVPEESAAPDAAAILPKIPARPTDEKVALSSPAPVEPRTEWTGWAGALWLAGVVLLGLGRTAGWLLVLRWKHAGLAPVPPWLETCYRAAAARMRIQPALLRVSRLVRSPMVCGCWRPVVLFPISLLTKLDAGQVEALLVHELTHLKRRDSLTNAAQIVIETILFYHPAVWWAGRRLRDYREHACDDAALHAGVSPLEYARTLATLGAESAAAAVSAGSGSLLGRVRRILTGRESAVPRPAVAALLPAVAAFALLTPRVESVTPEQPGTGTEDAARFRYRWQHWGERGKIADRNGVVLAGNVERWTLHIECRAVSADYVRLTGKQPLLRPPTEPGKPPAEDIAGMLTELLTGSGEAELRDLVAAGTPLAERYTRWLRRPNAEVNPWPVAAAAFTPAEQKRIAAAVKDWQCARLTRSSVRDYPLGARAAQVLGYTRLDAGVRGRLTDPAFAQSPEGRHSLAESCPTGMAGVERLMNGQLQGKDWYENGHFADGIQTGDDAPGDVHGADVFLTIDARMQAAAEEALRDAGVGRGAAVMLDVNNGDILAMASAPSFDPGAFPSGNRQSIEAIIQDGTNPLRLRATSQYAPGSGFKLVTALAGARAGLANTSFNCSGAITYDKRDLRCWIGAQSGGSHGTLNLEQALKCSCNCYFFQIGQSVRIEGIAEMAGFFGIGDEDGPIPGMSQPGFIGTPAYKQQQGLGAWALTDTANVSIGQGLLNVSPLQMAGVTAAIANGGSIWRPRLIHNQLAQKPEPGSLMADLVKQGVKPEDLKRIRRGMWQVVNATGGTGRNAQSPIGIAGKSGTAQQQRHNDARMVVDDFTTWFLAFAPYDAPRYAIAVVVENGTAGGKTCAPIAKRILEQALSITTSGECPVPLPGEPLKGHYDKVDAVIYAEPVK